MRRIGIVVALVVSALLVAGVVYLKTRDLDDYRGLIAARVKAATGRALTLDGALSLKLFTMTPAIVARQVGLANAAWGSRPRMITVKRLEAEVGLWGLLFGRPAIKRIVLISPNILLETNRKGAGNWVFTGAAPTVWPSIRLVRIENARIVYRDGRTGRERSLTIARMVARPTGGDGALAVTLTGAFAGKPVDVTARLGPLDRLLRGGRPWPIALSGRIGATRLTAKGSLALSKGPTRLRLRIDAPVLDMRDFAVGGGGGSRRLLSRAPLPWLLLDAVDAVVTARIGRLLGLGPVLRDASLTLVAGQGRLRLKPATARVSGGRLDVDIAVTRQGAGGALTADLTLVDGRLGVLTRELTGAASLTGAYRLIARLRGRGNSLGAIMAKADGVGTLIGGRGKLHHALFSFLSADVVGAVTPWVPVQAPTNVLCTVARFDVRGGVARSRVLVLDTDRATIIGDGVVDLRNETLNILFDPTTKDPSLLSVAALVPVRVSGALRHPTAAPAVGAAVGETARAVIGVVGKGVDAAKWVGAQIGLTTGPRRRRGSPCARARTIAARADNPGAGRATTPRKRRKRRGLLDDLRKVFE